MFLFLQLQSLVFSDFPRNLNIKLLFALHKSILRIQKISAKHQMQKEINKIENNMKRFDQLSTYRRIRHASSHLVRASICWTIAPGKASRCRHFHFVRRIHWRHRHASTGKILFELQRFGGAFKWRWRINFAEFLLTLVRKLFILLLLWIFTFLLTVSWRKFRQTFSHFFSTS